MNKKLAILITAASALLGAGCTHNLPKAPSAGAPGVIHIVLTGKPDTVAAFTSDARIPQNCRQKPDGQTNAKATKEPGSGAAQAVFRCENTTAETIRQFGEIYLSVVNRRSRVKQASLDPVRVAQDPTDALGMNITTTACIPDSCFTGTAYWWMPQGACFDPCF